MKKILFVACIFLVAVNFHGNAQTCSWLHQGGYTQCDGYYSRTAIDRQGNVVAIFATNYYNQIFGTDTFGGLSHNNGVIAKYDSAGNYLWGRIIDAPNFGNDISGLAIDYNNNIYVTGTFASNPLHLSLTDSLIGYDSGENGYLAKYDPSGTLLWYKGYSASSSSSVGLRGLTVDHANNVIVGGSFYYNIDLGDTTLTGDQENILLVKYSENGSLIWARSSVSNEFAWVSALTVDSANNIYFTGKESQPITFGTTYYGFTPAGDNLYVGKYSAGGDFQWFVRRYGNWPGYLDPNPINNCGYDIAADKAGNVYVIGSVLDTIYTDTGKVSGEQVYYAKFRSDSTEVWHKVAGTRPATNGPWQQSVHSLGGVAVDGCGYPYITATYTDTIVLGGTTLYGNINGEAYIAKIDTGTGDAIWVKHSAGTSTYAQSIAVQKGYGNIVASGNFTPDQSFDVLSQTFPPYNPVCRNFYLLAIENPIDCPVDDSDIVIPNSVTKVGAEQNVKIYPNPVVNELAIENAQAGSEIRIFNQFGQVVYSAVISAKQQIINTGKFPAGAYMVQISDGQGNKVTSMIVKE